jgi:hypothetical protein
MEQHSDYGHRDLPFAVWGEILRIAMWVTSPPGMVVATPTAKATGRCVCLRASDGVEGDLLERPRQGCAQFVPGGKSELGERGVKMALHRPHRERERVGDLHVGGSLRRQ